MMRHISHCALALCLLVSTPTVANITNSADLEAFADGVIETSMRDANVAGAVLGVVEGDQVVLLKGYGFADVESGAPVDPDTTLFRPGSVTKLFTWIALMQLRDAGQIDFDTDVNTYLKSIKVPEAFNAPITIRHLMTHTPGFEDHVLGLFGSDESTMRTLQEVIATEMPARVRPPGELASYSNHGVGIAGLIIEDVSGIPWAQYIEENITDPLGMDFTTMRQPLPAELEEHMSGGYAWQAGEYVAQDFEFVPAAPAGSASASAGDMVILIRTLLGGGEPILSRESTQEMFEELHRANDFAGGLLHGFYEFSSHDEFLLGHGGDTIWFHSEFVLLPERDIGWFISTNSAAGPAVRGAFMRGFMDRYFEPTAPEPVSMSAAELARFSGYYAPLRHSHDDFTKLIRLIGAISVQPDPSTGELLMMAGEVQRLQPIAPNAFKSPLSEGVVSFDLAADGSVTHMHISNVPVIAFEKLSGMASPALHQFVITVSGLVFLWVLIVWSIQRHYRQYVLPAAEARFRLVTWWMGFSVVLFVCATALTMGGPNDVVFGLPTGLRIALMIPWITIALALLSVVLYAGVFRESSVTRLGRAGYAIVMLAGVGFSWFVLYWRIAG